MNMITGGLLLLAFMSAPPQASSEPIQAKIIIFQNSQGIVTLKHLEHSEIKGVKCIACHHRYIRAKPAACSRCHPRNAEQRNEKSSEVLRKDALHKSCIDCHKMTSETSSETPPIKCEGCHESSSPETPQK